MGSTLPFRYLAISDRTLCPEPVPERCNRLAELGVPGLQIRDKDVSDRERWSWIERLQGNGTTLLVNGRVDLAILGNLDGVHVPSSGLPPDVLKRVAGKDMIFGGSTHTIDEVREAGEVGLDYVVFGPVYPTPSKPRRDEDEIPGLRGLERAAEAAAVPVLALGGVTPERLEACLDAGAHGAAGIRALFEPEDPRENWIKFQDLLGSEG